MLESNLGVRSSNGKKRILVIEDELINREILGLILRDTYDILFAETGSQALQILKDQFSSVSLVLLDLNLPDIKGTDILRQMKDDAGTALLPVIVMTADQDAEVECLHLGAIDFIPKPYPKQEVVLARILRTIELFEDRDIIRWTERDHLTRLYNREFFFRYAVQFDDSHLNASTDAVLLNINHFHILNERYGKESGNEVLRRIADILRETIPESEGIVCREEADTFLVYCLHRNDYEALWDRICADMTEYHVRLRIGVYAQTDPGISMEQRFHRAKQAANTVKSSFSGAVGVYNATMHEKEVFSEQLMEDFHTALLEEQFTVFYQPKFNIQKEQPVLSSAEALVRWKHPKHGFISPGIFIPVFEQNGLIRELDTYVWKKTAAQIKEWKTSLGMTIPVSVNVSRVNLYDPLLPETLGNIAKAAGIKNSELWLEITESAYTNSTDQIINTVNALRSSGFHIEMDDFGTGYSSLNMITTLPIEALKLDMQFIRMAFREHMDTRLLRAIIWLAQSLGLPVIAEGVETAEQIFTLRVLGCDYVQGYYFSKPLPPDEFEAFVKNREKE
jgi:diguanylate cyclase (GGDEF) domain